MDTDAYKGTARDVLEQALRSEAERARIYAQHFGEALWRDVAAHLDEQADRVKG